MKLFRLCFILGYVFASELYKTLKKEVSDKDFMPQKNYQSCNKRVEALIENAVKRVKNILSLAVAHHRCIIHGDDCQSEIDSLVEMMGDRDVKTAERSWWKW